MTLDRQNQELSTANMLLLDLDFYSLHGLLLPIPPASVLPSKLPVVVEDAGPNEPILDLCSTSGSTFLTRLSVPSASPCILRIKHKDFFRLRAEVGRRTLRWAWAAKICSYTQKETG